MTATLIPRRRTLPTPGPGWWAAPAHTVRSPALAAALAAAVALLALAGAAGPLFTAAAANDALAREVAAFNEEALGASVQVHGRLEPGGWAAADAHMRGVADRLGLDRPRVSIGPLDVSVHDAGTGRPATVGYSIGFPIDRMALYARSGAVAHLPDRRGEGPGVWLPRRVAADLAVGTGDEVVLASSTGGDASVRVAGTYRDLVEAIPTSAYTGPQALRPDDPAAAYWAPLERLIAQVSPQGDPLPAPPLVVAEPTTVAALGERLGEPFTALAWRFPFDAQGATVTQAQAALVDQQALEAEALDRATPLGAALHALGDPRGADLGVDSLLDGAIERPAALVAALDASLTPLTLGAQAFAILAVAAVAAAIARRRRSETAMLAVQGAGTWWLISRGWAEAALPALGGALAGAAAATTLAARVGPLGGPEPAVVQSAAGAALGAAVLGVVLVGGAAALMRPGGGGPRGAVLAAIGRRVPWVLLLAAATAAAGAAVAGGDRGLLLGGGDVRQVDVLAVGFPLLVVVTVAAATARLVARMPSRLRRLGTRAPAPVFLATRRLMAARGQLPAAVGAVTLGTGLLAFGVTAAASGEATIEAKASVAAGAPLAITLPPRETIPADLTGQATEVLRTEGALIPARQDVEVLAVDPATFADAAAWVDGFADRSLPDLLAALSPDPANAGDPAGRSRDAEGEADGATAERLPVIAVGFSPAGVSNLVTARYALAVRVVGEARAFSGMRGERMLVVDADRLVAAANQQDTSFDERLILRRRRELWLADEDADLSGVGAVHLGHRSVRELAEVRERPDLRAAGATFGYLRAVGVLAGGLALVLLLAYAVVRERERAAALALAQRMGLSAIAARLALAVELGLIVVLGAVVGTAVGLVAARALVTVADPLPQLPPASLFTVPTAQLVATGVVLCGAVVAGALLAGRAVRRLPAGAVLREG